MAKDDFNTEWWEEDPDYLDLSPGNLPELFKVESPADVISRYPDMTWKVLKLMTEENVALKARVEKLLEEITRLREAARMEEVRKHCGDRPD